jgi:hypothetical protein
VERDRAAFLLWRRQLSSSSLSCLNPAVLKNRFAERFGKQGEVTIYGGSCMRMTKTYGK